MRTTSLTRSARACGPKAKKQTVGIQGDVARIGGPSRQLTHHSRKSWLHHRPPRAYEFERAQKRRRLTLSLSFDKVSATAAAQARWARARSQVDPERNSNNTAQRPVTPTWMRKPSLSGFRCSSRDPGPSTRTVSAGRYRKSGTVSLSPAGPNGEPRV
jgi:hypothetical protein